MPGADDDNNGGADASVRTAGADVVEVRSKERMSWNSLFSSSDDGCNEGDEVGRGSLASDGEEKGVEEEELCMEEAITGNPLYRMGLSKHHLIEEKINKGHDTAWQQK